MTVNKKRRNCNDSLDKTIPKDFRKIILELEDKPLWLQIGKYLSSVPIREHVDRLRLIDELSATTGADYYKISGALEDLEKEGYIYVKRASKPDHFLTPHFAEALRLWKEIETDVINPMLSELKEDPDFAGQKDLDRSVRRALYSVLF
jgi:DNA-binding transcriptional MocR family regulator